MAKVLLSIDEVKKMILADKPLLLAGDEKLLDQLPKGQWIAGTIPYFMGDNGGEFTQEKIYVTLLPDYVKGIEIRKYTVNNIYSVFEDLPNHGFGVIIIPAATGIHEMFSVNAQNYKDFALKPLIGWISGVYLNDLGKAVPKVYYGPEAKKLENEAVVLSVQLPPDKVPYIGTVNMFKQGKGDTITFEQDGFKQKDALVNGKKINFAEYLAVNRIDVRLPLVADLFGAMINVSFQEINGIDKTVSLYAPVFKGMRYKVAEPVGDYIDTFKSMVPTGLAGKIVFSCNCILNYLYSELEGEKTGEITGPITFGEIAYQLLNQTLVYLKIEDSKK
jgi:hypothetical protein